MTCYNSQETFTDHYDLQINVSKCMWKHGRTQDIHTGLRHISRIYIFFHIDIDHELIFKILNNNN